MDVTHLQLVLHNSQAARSFYVAHISSFILTEFFHIWRITVFLAIWVLLKD